MREANFGEYHIRKWFGRRIQAAADGRPIASYDTVTASFTDAPAPDEVVAIFACATRGRLHARLGGLAASAVVGNDGLR